MRKNDVLVFVGLGLVLLILVWPRNPITTMFTKKTSEEQCLEIVQELKLECTARAEANNDILCNQRAIAGYKACNSEYGIDKDKRRQKI
mgnify:CR=1 FL=1